MWNITEPIFDQEIRSYWRNQRSCLWSNIGRIIESSSNNLYFLCYSVDTYKISQYKRFKFFGDKRNHTSDNITVYAMRIIQREVVLRIGKAIHKWRENMWQLDVPFHFILRILKTIFQKYAILSQPLYHTNNTHSTAAGQIVTVWCTIMHYACLQYRLYQWLWWQQIKAPNGASPRRWDIALIL